MEERRQSGRWQMDKPVGVRPEGRDIPLECKIQDLSFKGLKINSPEEFQEGSILAVEIPLDNGVSLNAEAAVVWHNPQESGNICGLCFTKIKDIDRGHIYRYVHKNCKDQLRKQIWQGVC